MAVDATILGSIPTWQNEIFFFHLITLEQNSDISISLVTKKFIEKWSVLILDSLCLP